MSLPSIAIQTSVSSNYQTYIPTKVRSFLKLKPSQKLNWLISEDSIEIRKEKSQEELIDSMVGIAKDLYKEYGGGQKWLEKEREGWRDRR